MNLFQIKNFRNTLVFEGKSKFIICKDLINSIILRKQKKILEIRNYIFDTKVYFSENTLSFFLISV
jgi:hypothetical protein